MQIEVDPKLIELVESQGEKIKTAINEGLNLWLKQKLITCPMTKKFCTNNQNPCNECTTFTQSHKLNLQKYF
ncbi:MAG: hypothetical protein P8X91_05040 [Candidatus Bathyarchaeota archaeon]